VWVEVALAIGFAIVGGLIEGGGLRPALSAETGSAGLSYDEATSRADLMPISFLDRVAAKLASPGESKKPRSAAPARASEVRQRLARQQPEEDVEDVD
jgi:uncharacterized protein (DUF2384 family)